MWRDLVVFPLADFRHVRAEYFPIVPRIRPTLVGTAREIVHWGRCNLALVPLLVGLWVCWPVRHRLNSAQRFILVFAGVAFVFFWSAAHVQLNTHAITLAGLGGLYGTAAAHVRARERRLTVLPRSLSLAFVAGWMCLLTAEAGYLTVQGHRQGQEWLNLSGLRGIRVPQADAQWMRGLSAAIATAGPPGAPLLMLSNRNDIMVYADSTPYWLSGRRPVTRHHELHPGVTDTAEMHQEMLAAIRPLEPVVVREHRFAPGQLDEFKRRVQDAGVPVGSGLLDEWVARHYDPGLRFGRYELMRRRGAESAAPN
jgi:hypothetical protein